MTEETAEDKRQRTLLQNRSLHLYCELLAVALNDAGLDMKKVLKPGVDIPWNKDMVKEHLWRPIQQVMTDKLSTTEIDTTDPGEIYKVLDRHIAEKFGVSVPWPSKETQSMEALMRDAG